jgi:hypothetical protein
MKNTKTKSKKIMKGPVRKGVVEIKTVKKKSVKSIRGGSAGKRSVRKGQSPVKRKSKKSGKVTQRQVKGLTVKAKKLKKKVSAGEVIKKSENIRIKDDRMSTMSLAYLLSGIYEAVLALPILGWLMGVHSFGFFWVVGIVANTTVLVLAIKNKKPIYGNVTGLIANIFGIVPILGWFLHLLATTLIFILFFKEER